MGELREVRGERACLLQPEHLIGRGAQCALRLEPDYVSTQHAVIRWNGLSWELLDRGSRNGTRLGDARIVVGRPYLIASGAVIAFGHPEEKWVLSDASPPQVLLAALDTGERIVVDGSVAGVPSEGDPQCTLYRQSDGSWVAEGADGSGRVLLDGDELQAGGRLWRFSCPGQACDGTVALGDGDAGMGMLHFGVSLDEEFVTLELERATGSVDLGSRSQNYLLLVLARARLSDLNAGIPATACGWRYKEDLAKQLRMSPERIDGEVFRIRQHFSQRGVAEAGTIIERKPRAKELRIGTARLRVTQA